MTILVSHQTLYLSMFFYSPSQEMNKSCTKSTETNIVFCFLKYFFLKKYKIIFLYIFTYASMIIFYYIDICNSSRKGKKKKKQRLTLIHLAIYFCVGDKVGFDNK
jgi:hypothetical protein